MKKTIAIYFSDPEPMGYPFDEGEYFYLYQEVIKDINENGIEVFFVRGDSYIEQGKFKKGWYFENGTLKENNNTIKADLIFNRDDKNTIPSIYDCPIINHPDFDKLCIDKYLTYKTFPNISPKTYLLNSYQEFLSKCEENNFDAKMMIVLKKNFLAEGRGIHILRVEDVNERINENWHDILLQEFLDASAGIPQIVDTNHDLRVEVINGEISHSLVRIPKPGSYLANVSRGASSFTLPIEKIPSQVKEMVDMIQNKINNYRPLLYSADFMNTGKGFKLLELNSRPGLLFKRECKHEEWNGKIAQMLIKAVQNT